MFYLWSIVYWLTVLMNLQISGTYLHPINILHTLWDVTILWSSERWSALGSLCSLLRPPWDNSRPGKSFLSTALPWKFIVVVRIQSFFLKFIRESLKIWLTDDIYFHLMNTLRLKKYCYYSKRHLDFVTLMSALIVRATVLLLLDRQKWDSTLQAEHLVD